MDKNIQNEVSYWIYTGSHIDAFNLQKQVSTSLELFLEIVNNFLILGFEMTYYYT